MHRGLKMSGRIVAVIAVFASAVGLGADSAVRIKSGSVVVGSPVSLTGGGFNIEGRQNFSYTGGAEGGTSEGDCGPCLAGDTISLTTELSGTYFGALRYKGQTYDLDISNGSGTFTFASPDFVLPPADGEGVVTVQQPFSLVDSSFTLPGTAGVVPVEGSGTATARFTTFQDGGDTLYFLVDISFAFEN